MTAGAMTGKRQTWKSMTPAERDAAKAESREADKARTADLLAKLDAEISRVIASDEGLREYLRCSARMWDYSYGNRFLIMIQRPDARMVAGFNKWKSLGRPVRKGSKAIRILAPTKIPVIDEATGEKSVRLVGFHSTCVFADVDTDGPPIGSTILPIPLTDDSEEAAAACERLRAAGVALGCTIDIPCGDPRLGDGSTGPAGWCKLDSREIVVNGDLPAAARFKTLTHEIAHAIANHRAEGDDRRDAEIVAEGSAFIVAEHYGFDTTGYSAPYIAGWAGDVPRVRRLFERIAKVSREIIAEAEMHGGCSGCGWDGIADGGGCEVCR